jgi:hypothetical protein
MGDISVIVSGVHLTFIRKTVLSSDTKCPSLYKTDRDTFIVQGWRVTDPEALKQLDIPAHETVVEVPSDVLAEIARAI